MPSPPFYRLAGRKDDFARSHSHSVADADLIRLSASQCDQFPELTEQVVREMRKQAPWEKEKEGG